MAEAKSLSELLKPEVRTGQQVVSDAFVTELQQSISRGADFTATATTPGFTYKYDPELKAFVRGSSTLGPAFLERAETVGEGHADLGVTILYASFKEKDGTDLSDLEEPFLVKSVGIFERGDVAFDKLNLETYGFYASGTYGITQDIDVNLLVPLFYTTLSTDKTVTTPSFGTSMETADGDKFGIGDVQLRGKWRVLDKGGFLGATGLSLRFPTGDEDDFQGIGEYTVTPAFILSRAVSRFDYHGSVGVQFNAGDIDRSLVQYGVGASYAILDQITFNLDIIGYSQFSDDDVSSFAEGVYEDDFSGTLPAGVSLNGRSNGTEVITTIDRVDVVDLAVGLKFNPFGKGVLFLSLIVPLNEDGVRTDFIPVGGFEVSF